MKQPSESFTFALIPVEVGRLIAGESLATGMIWSYIDFCTKGNGGCEEPNEFFRQLTGQPLRTTVRAIGKLKAMGLITIEGATNKRILKSLTPDLAIVEEQQLAPNMTQTSAKSGHSCFEEKSKIENDNEGLDENPEMCISSTRNTSSYEEVGSIAEAMHTTVTSKVGKVRKLKRKKPMRLPRGPSTPTITSPSANHIIEYWNEKGLRHHKLGTKMAKTIEEKINKICRKGGWDVKVTHLNKGVTTTITLKGTIQDIKDAIDNMVEDATAPGKAWLRKISLSDFFYNDRVQRSSYAEYRSGYGHRSFDHITDRNPELTEYYVRFYKENFLGSRSEPLSEKSRDKFVAVAAKTVAFAGDMGTMSAERLARTICEDIVLLKKERLTIHPGFFLSDSLWEEIRAQLHSTGYYNPEGGGGGFTDEDGHRWVTSVEI